MGLGASTRKENAGPIDVTPPKPATSPKPTPSPKPVSPAKSDSPAFHEPAAQSTDGQDVESIATKAPEVHKLLGKDKYVKEYGALAMEDRNAKKVFQGTLFLFCARGTDDITFSYRDHATGSVFAKRFTDEELGDEKNKQGVRFTWAPFFKSIATALIKSKTTAVAAGVNAKTVAFTIVNKDTTTSYPFVVTMDLVSSKQKLSRAAFFTYVMEPLSRSLQYSRRRATEGTKALTTVQMECNIKVHSATVELYKKKVEELLPLIRPLREESAVCSHVAMTLGRDVRNMERRIYDQKNKRTQKHPLDALYDEGGAQYFQHTVWSPEHRPREEEPDELLTECIRTAFPLPSGATLDSISTVLEQPDLKKRIDESGNRHLIEEAFEIFKGVDRWDYDTIQLEIITNGNALFYTTYLLLYKLDLMAHFQLDDQVVRNFLVAVQSAYHPNPYHNAMHGADVTQINYYIMMVAGLKEKCSLSKEEILASLIAGAVHDFDHPGLNNNFHTRTNSFLATLYNDRSILENHHIACTFELLRSPRYDIFAPLNADQKQLVRDTMLEMVLATDMGNHAKIFKNFTVRMSETSDWHSKKEDVRLALSMSIKMADISNCARPNHIYAEWAKNISKEFYLQGDAERKLKLSISPFMDRTKEREEFPKGQISFMMYIVQPMVEAISEFLPSLSFAINLCNENKDYWRMKQEQSSAGTA